MDLTGLIDHTCLHADAGKENILGLCHDAVNYGFYSVCVPPCWVSEAKKCLQGEKPLVVSVVGFPLGFSSTTVKVFEAENTLADGADELDMVINIGALKEKRTDYVGREIEAVLSILPNGAVLKVIIETALLNHREKISAVQTAVEAGAHFIKTSTGYGPSGALVEDIKLIRSIANGRAGIKAAGGIRTADQALALIQAGASRLGCSSSVKILREYMRLR